MNVNDVLSFKEADKIEIPALSDSTQFRAWRISVRDAVASASKDPERAFGWIRKVEDPSTTVEMLGDSEGFAALDSKLANALTKVTKGVLARDINLEK